MKHLMSLTDKWKTNSKIIFNNRFRDEALSKIETMDSSLNKAPTIIEKLSPDWSCKKRNFKNESNTKDNIFFLKEKPINSER